MIDFLGPAARPNGVRILKQDRVQNQVRNMARKCNKGIQVN